MLLQPVIDSVNGIGYSIGTAVSTFLGINHVLASNLVHLVVVVFQFLQDVFCTFLTALQILLEDLFVFLTETLESLVVGTEFIFSIVDAFCNGIVNSINYVKYVCLASVSGTYFLLGQAYGSIASVIDSLAYFFYLLGSSIVLLVQLFPKTLFIVTNAILKCFQDSLTSMQAGAQALTQSFHQTPYEMILGAFTGALIVFSTYRLVRKCIRDFNITPVLIFSLFLNLMGSFYLNVVTVVRFSICLLFRCVTVTLNHLHVPRFHHGGDSDNEDATNNEEEAAANMVGYDSSDNEENERMEEKRRNYNLLLKRREMRNLRVNSDDVENILFDQVEREREDKLCVICQDKEKCIMILPCRHLCLCQECTGPLQNQGNNNCPICRKKVRQTIKAYL